MMGTRNALKAMLAVLVSAAMALNVCWVPQTALAEGLSGASMVDGKNIEGAVLAHQLRTEEADTFLVSRASAAGSEEDPYLVSTEQDLYELAKVVNGMVPENGAWVSTGTPADSLAGKFVRLENDITLTDPAVPIGVGAVVPMWAGISNPVCFSGTFLGNGKVIYGWSSSAGVNPPYETVATSGHDSNSFSALFGAVSGAAIHDLTVVLKGGFTGVSSVAGLVAISTSGTTVIDHCAVVGDVVSTGTGSNNGGVAGGLVARCMGGTLSITHSYHTGKVTASSIGAGGLVGYVAHPSGNVVSVTIENSYQSGAVSDIGLSSSGVFIGTGRDKTYVSGCVTDQGLRLVGANHSNVAKSENITAVNDWQGASVVEALGADFFDFSDEATQNGSVAPPFKERAEEFSVVFDAGAADVVGSVPTSMRKAEGAVFTLPSSSLTRPGFDFAGWRAVWSESVDDVSYQAGDEFAMPAAPVTFTAQWSPWKAVDIDSEAQLRQLAEDVNSGAESTVGKTYRLANDLTLVRGAFTPIGSYGHPFKGTFDGAGHVISGLSVSDDEAVPISGSSYKGAGLFGKVESATIRDLGVVGSLSAGDTAYAGGLVAYAGGTKSAATVVSGCFTCVAVEGKTYVGGLVGSMIFASLSNSYAVGSVSSGNMGSDLRLGGLVGNVVPGNGRVLADGENLISGCYSACAVSIPPDGKGKAAALVGCVYDTALTEDGGWTRLGGTYSLECDLPLYFAYSQSEQYSSSAPNGLKATLMLTVEELASAVTDGKLGDAFKSDNAHESFQVNNGFPVMKWQVLPNVEFPVSYVLAGGSWRAGAEVPRTYEPDGEAVDLPGVDMLSDRADYLFMGWYDNEAYEGQPVTKIAAGSTGEKRFFALWRHRSLLRADAISEAAAAEALFKGVVTSAAGSGADVYADKRWVSRAVWDALYSAVSAVSDLPELAEVSEIQSSRSALAEAASAFKPAYGLKKYALDASAVKLSSSSCIYDGKVKTPTVSVSYGGKSLTFGRDYKVSVPAGRINAGSYAYTVAGCGKYSGTVRTTLVIGKAKITAVTLKTKSYTYNGTARKPAVAQVKAGALSVPASAYVLSYSANRNVSSNAVATVKAKAGTNFTGSAQVKFSIKKAKNAFSVKAANRTVKVSKLKKAKQVVAGASVAKKGQGSIAYKKVSGSSRLTVAAKTGKVTVKKGTKAGTYKIKVKARASGTANYSPSSWIACLVTVKVK